MPGRHRMRAAGAVGVIGFEARGAVDVESGVRPFEHGLRLASGEEFLAGEGAQGNRRRASVRISTLWNPRCAKVLSGRKRHR